MKTRIDIDTKTFVRFWLVVIGFGLAILALYNARVALIILGVSFFLAIALNSPVSRISKILPGKSRVGATAIAYVLVIVLLGLIVTLVIPVETNVPAAGDCVIVRLASEVQLSVAVTLAVKSGTEAWQEAFAKAD